MTTFLWESRFATGVEAMDAQHRKIFDYMTRIYNEISDKHQKCDLFGGMLSQLELLCQLHFLEEERWMDGMSYPSAAEHKRHHDLFLAAIDRFRIGNNQCHSPGVVDDFLDLREGFITHMLDETILLGDFIKRNVGVNSVAPAG